MPQESELCEVYLPDVSIVHMRKAIKFMYIGRIKISKKEIEQQHVVWHINNILKDILHIDAKLNLDPSLLRPPPVNDNDGSGRSGGGPNNNCDNNKDGSNNHLKPSGAGGTNNNPTPIPPPATPGDIDNTRQNTTLPQEPVQDFAPIIDGGEREASAGNSRTKNVKVEMSPVCEEDDRNVPTPDIIDLLDSDSEDDVDAGNELGNLNEESVDPMESTVDESDNIDIVDIPIIVEAVHSQVEEQDKTQESSAPVVRRSLRRKSSDDSKVGPSEKKRKPCVKSVEKLSKPKTISPDILTIAVEAIQSNSKDNMPVVTPKPIVARKSRPPSLDDSVMVMVASPAASVSSGEGTIDPLSPGPSMAKTRRPSGDKVRKHNHIPWTMSGLQRPDTINDINEGSDVHVCPECDAKFEKAKSLKIHMGRTHNERATVPCPKGCGKMLTTPAAIKKHLLSHIPEEEWPYECPLCHKKFQARGDIPKHLKTKVHENDNIPSMGSQGWFDLIYHDDPNYDYESHKRKLDKMKAKGMQPSNASGSVSVSSDSHQPVPFIPGLDENNTLTLQLPVIHVDSQYNLYQVNQ